MTIDIKYPPSIDISHWIEIEDFNAIKPVPWLIFTKATQGLHYLDSKVAEYAPMIRSIGARLGLYHFMTQEDPIQQADWFVEIASTLDIRMNEPLACDMEVSGIGAVQIRAFQDRVQLKLGIRPILYSTQLMIEALYLPLPPPAWLKSEWLWIAEYPGNPDIYDYLPDWIVPVGCLKSKIAQWQYTDDGVYPGIPGNNVDLNLVSETYSLSMNLTEPLENPGDVIVSEPTYYADLKIGQISNVRFAAGLSSLIKEKITGPLTITIVSEKIQLDGYDWYQINSPVEGFIALTGAYENFRPATPTPNPLPQLTISIAGEYDVIDVQNTGGSIQIILQPK